MVLSEVSAEWWSDFDPKASGSRPELYGLSEDQIRASLAYRGSFGGERDFLDALRKEEDLKRCDLNELRFEDNSDSVSFESELDELADYISEDVLGDAQETSQGVSEKQGFVLRPLSGNSSDEDF